MVLQFYPLVLKKVIYHQLNLESNFCEASKPVNNLALVPELPKYISLIGLINEFKPFPLIIILFYFF